MSSAKVAKFVAAIAGVAGYVGGSLLAVKLLHLVPGIGTGSCRGYKFNPKCGLYISFRQGSHWAV